MDPHRVQRVLDLVRHAGGQAAQRRELLRVAHQRLDGPGRLEVAQHEQSPRPALRPTRRGYPETAHSRGSPVPAASVDRVVARRGRRPSRSSRGEAGQGVRGREGRRRTGGRRASGRASRSAVALANTTDALGAEKDHGVLETGPRRPDPGPAAPPAVAWMRSPRPFIRSARRPMSSPGPSSSAGVAARQALDPAARCGGGSRGARGRLRARARSRAPSAPAPRARLRTSASRSVWRTRLVDTPTCTVPNGCSPRRTGRRTS